MVADGFVLDFFSPTLLAAEEGGGLGNVIVIGLLFIANIIAAKRRWLWLYSYCLSYFSLFLLAAAAVVSWIFSRQHY